MAFTKLSKKKYANVTVWGRQGTGKTVSALLAASVLHRKSPCKIAVFDTENALGAMTNAIEALGMGESVMHWVALMDDLKKPMGEEFLDFLQAARKEGAGIVLVDSVTDILKNSRAQWQERNTRKIPLSMYAEIDYPFKRSIEKLKALPMHAIYTVKEKTETITRGDKEDTNPEPDIKDFEYLSDIKVHTEVEKPRGGSRLFRATVVSRYAKGVAKFDQPTVKMWEEILSNFCDE